MFFHHRKNFAEYRAELPINLPTVPLQGKLPSLRPCTSSTDCTDVVIICKDVKTCREVLPRVKSTVVPSVMPAEEMIPLQYYRNLRRTIRGKYWDLRRPNARAYHTLIDLEKCRGEYKGLKKVDDIYDWLKSNAGQFDTKGYETYRNEFMDIRSATLPLACLRGLIVCCSYKIEPKPEGRSLDTSRI